MLDMFGERVYNPQPCAAAPLADATAPPPPEELPCGAWPVQPAAEPLAEGRQEGPMWTGVNAEGPADWEGLGPPAMRPTALALACADARMAGARSPPDKGFFSVSRFSFIYFCLISFEVFTTCLYIIYSSGQELRLLQFQSSCQADILEAVAARLC